MIKNECLYCNSSKIKILDVIDRNREISKKLFHYSYCYECKNLSNISNIDDLSKYYKNEDTPFAIKESNYDKIVKKNYYFFKIFNKFVTHGSVLELGPGYGYFSKILISKGFDLTIIEQDRELCNFYEKRLKINKYICDDFINTPDQNEKYNAIVAFQVIEHLKNPKEWVNKIYNSLDKNGFFFISTPNARSIQFLLMQHLWPHLDAPRHQIIFSPSSVENLLNEYNFKKIYVNWKIDTILWNFFGWKRFFHTILKNTQFNYFAKFFSIIFFILFFLIEIIPGFGCSYIHVYKKEN